MFRIHNVRRAVVHVVEGLAAKVPRAVIVVFGPGAVDGGQLVAIDEDHIVALAEPLALVQFNGVGDAHKMSLALGFEEDVIPFPIQIFAVADRRLVLVVPVIGPALAGRGLAVLRVKTAQIAGQAGQGHVVHGKVEAVGADRALVGRA